MKAASDEAQRQYFVYLVNNYYAGCEISQHNKTNFSKVYFIARYTTEKGKL